MTKEASNLPPDVLHRAHQEIKRGVSPDVAADIGEFVPEVSQLRPEDHARVMPDVKASIITPQPRRKLREMPRQGANNEIQPKSVVLTPDKLRIADEGIGSVRATLHQPKEQEKEQEGK